MPHITILLSMIILITGSYTISFIRSLFIKYPIEFLTRFYRFILVFNIYFLLQAVLEYIYINLKGSFTSAVQFRIGIYTDLFFSLMMIAICWLILELLYSLPVSLPTKRRVSRVMIVLFILIISVHLYFLLFLANPFHFKSFKLLMLAYVFIFHLLTIILFIFVLIRQKTKAAPDHRFFLTRLSLFFIFVKGSSLVYLVLFYFRIVNFNLTFFLVFFLYNLVPLIFLKRLIEALFSDQLRPSTFNGRMDEKMQQFGISKREREIISLILAGLSNREIEEKLFISIATVKDHIYHIYKKTGVKNRVQLVNLFQTDNSTAHDI